MVSPSIFPSAALGGACCNPRSKDEPTRTGQKWVKGAISIVELRENRVRRRKGVLFLRLDIQDEVEEFSLIARKRLCMDVVDVVANC